MTGTGVITGPAGRTNPFPKHRGTKKPSLKVEKPDCPVCPLQDDCRARVQGLAHRLPVRGKKKSIPHREVVSAVIRDGNGRLLIVQRPARGLLGSLKFPGGILNPEEPPEEGLVRIARKELGLEICVGSPSPR